MTGRFNTFHEAVVADLTTALTPIAVQEHFGPFNVDELQAFGARAPACLVSITGPSPTRPRATGDREADLVVMAFIVTRSTPTQLAHKAAQDIAERLAARVHKNTFGLRFVEPPQDVQIDNLYSGKLRQAGGAGVALFAVSWQQLVIFGLETAPVPDPADVPATPPEFSFSVDGDPPSDPSPLAGAS
jgi:hypothetical protein